MAGFALFGLDALPFKIVVFATQFAALMLMASIGARLTGSRAAGVGAAVLWVTNGPLIVPLGWTCVYNQVLCGFFLLLAFHFLLRFLETGRRALRNPAVGGISARLRRAGTERGLSRDCREPIPARSRARYFRRTLPMFAVSLGLRGRCTTPWRRCERAGDYGMHFTGSMLGHAGHVLDLVGRPDLPLHALPARALDTARRHRRGVARTRWPSPPQVAREAIACRCSAWPGTSSCWPRCSRCATT